MPVYAVRAVHEGVRAKRRPYLAAGWGVRRGQAGYQVGNVIPGASLQKLLQDLEGVGTVAAPTDLQAGGTQLGVLVWVMRDTAAGQFACRPKGSRKRRAGMQAQLA